MTSGLQAYIITSPNPKLPMTTKLKYNSSYRYNIRNLKTLQKIRIIKWCITNTLIDN